MILCGGKDGNTLHLIVHKDENFTLLIQGPKGGMQGAIGVRRTALESVYEQIGQVLKEIT